MAIVSWVLAPSLIIVEDKSNTDAVLLCTPRGTKAGWRILLETKIYVGKSKLPANDSRSAAIVLVTCHKYPAEHLPRALLTETLVLDCGVNMLT